MGNRIVEVKFQPDLADETGAQIYGCYENQIPRITIRAGMSPLDTVETFWHEFFHAIFDFTRFQADMQAEMQSSNSIEEGVYNVEERHAENFAKVFLQVIQDNNIANIKQ